MKTADMTPMTVISAFEAVLAQAYLQAGQITGNDDDATALLIGALEESFGANPTTMPSARELSSRMSRRVGSRAA